MLKRQHITWIFFQHLIMKLNPLQEMNTLLDWMPLTFLKIFYVLRPFMGSLLATNCLVKLTRGIVAPRLA